MVYIDGFLAAVPNDRKDAYIAHCRVAHDVFRDAGALNVVDCWGDDVPPGILTSMPMAVQAGADETVVFSWIVWPSKDARNKGMDKVMADPRMQDDVNPMPFDGKRLIYGGFDVVLGTP
jgi:uncharacterized protein YbaA (DUF1428 family)